MSKQSLEFSPRSMYCGQVRPEHVGRELILKGWVHRRRDHGGIIFVDLRDREGLMQLRINPETLENDRKVGVDVQLAPAGDAAEAAKKLGAACGAHFHLVAIVQGDANLWPDARPSKNPAEPWQCRFLAANRDVAVGEPEQKALTAVLSAAGFDAKEPHLVSSTHQLRDEFCIAVRGEVIPRPAESLNPNLPTGATELAVKEICILSSSPALPFRLDEHGKTSEELRLRHRYLDLRRPELQANFIARHKLMQSTRKWLSDNGFLEFETPILGKPTPEGARDYLVPARMSPGMCYALPQSPQLFKQILMMSGFDRYFQIARCFRDEDLRANRQPEFTQVDIEMSFVTMEDVLATMEGLAAAMWKGTLGVDVPTPLRRMPYSEAIRRYGSDKPDLRFAMELQDLSDTMRGNSDFSVFNDVLAANGAIIGVVHEGGADKYSNTALRPDGDFNKRVQRETGAKGLAFFRMGDDGDLQSSISKFFKDDFRRALAAKLGMKPGDMLFLIGDKKAKRAFDMAGRLRLLIGREFGLVDKSKLEFLWVVDFPMFEYNDDENRWDPAHHPFTAPHPEDAHLLETEPGKVRSLAYDLVLNGEECAGGSIRIHRMDMQERIFRLIGIGDEEAKHKFGFLLDALKFGAPPHGGIAFGFDRCLMSMVGTESIREVIAFPKTQAGTCLMTGAPGDVTEAQLKEVHMKAIPAEKKETAPA